VENISPYLLLYIRYVLFDRTMQYSILGNLYSKCAIDLANNTVAEQKAMIMLN